MFDVPYEFWNPTTGFLMLDARQSFTPRFGYLTNGNAGIGHIEYDRDRRACVLHGVPGSGMDASVDVILYNALNTYSPDTLEVHMFDAKGTSLALWKGKGFAHIATNQSIQDGAVNFLCATVSRVEAQTYESKAVFVVIDNYTDLLEDEEMTGLLMDLLAVAKKVPNVYILLAAQVNIRMYALLDEIPIRLCLRCRKDISLITLKSKAAFYLGDRFGLICYLKDIQDDPDSVKTYHIPFIPDWRVSEGMFNAINKVPGKDQPSLERMIIDFTAPVDFRWRNGVLEAVEINGNYNTSLLSTNVDMIGTTDRDAIWYSCFIAESVLSAISSNSVVYKRALWDVNYLTELMQKAHAAGPWSEKLPLLHGTGVTGIISEELPAEGDPVFPAYYPDSHTVAAFNKIIVASDTACNCPCGMFQFHSNGISLSTRFGFYFMRTFNCDKDMTIICARLLLRYGGVVPNGRRIQAKPMRIERYTKKEAVSSIEDLTNLMRHCSFKE